MNSLEKQVVEWLKDFRPNSSPTDKESESPNYPMYALAPFWRPHQAVCLLADIATIDVDSFRAMLSLTPFQRKISAFMGKEMEPTQKNLSHYVAQKLPIPDEKIIHLKNLEQKIYLFGQQEACLLSGKVIHNGVKEKIFHPEQIIEWAKKEGIPVPSKLIQAMEWRSGVNSIYLPPFFPDEINVSGEYTALIIQYNLNKPLPIVAICSEPNNEEEQKALWPPLPMKDDQNEKEANGCARSLFEDLMGDESKKSSTSSAAERRKTKSPAARKPVIKADLPNTPKVAQELGHLNENGREIQQKMIASRKQIFFLSLEDKFEDEQERGKHSQLLTELSTVSENEFEQYKTKRLPPKLETKHRCLARGRFLRHFDPKYPIELMNDSFMSKYVWRNEPPPKETTIRSWMYQEGIYDKPPRSENLHDYS